MLPSTTSISPGGERMRRHRQRRRDGLRSLQVLLRDTEVAALIASGWLEHTSNDPHAVTDALHGLFDLIFSRMMRNVSTPG
jgi:hypothetical protein